MPAPNPQSGERSTVIHPVSADETRGRRAAGIVDTPHAWGQWTHPQPWELAAQMENCDVEQLLGRGGMGAVYRGRQRALDRAVAIRLLPGELSTNAEFSGRFHRETLAMASLEHPCIVKVLDFGKTRDGLLFYMMEFVDGGDLKGLLKEQGALPPRRAAEIVRDVCSALQCAHSRGILHRDIKPANILLTGDGRVRVADFGLALLTGGGPDSVTTMPGAMMGTPDYMAPEQSRGGDIDARADVYAAGVVLYQLLTGKLPQGAWKLPSSLLTDAEPDVTARLDVIVKKALQENVATRYAGANAMGAALEEILPARAATGSRPAAPGPSALLCSALLMAGAAWLLWETKIWRDVTTHVRVAVIGFAAPVEPAVAERPWISAD